MDLVSISIFLITKIQKMDWEAPGGLRPPGTPGKVRQKKVQKQINLFFLYVS